jgi:hypothetical protein
MNKYFKFRLNNNCPLNYKTNWIDILQNINIQKNIINIVLNNLKLDNIEIEFIKKNNKNNIYINLENLNFDSNRIIILLEEFVRIINIFLNKDNYEYNNKYCIGKFIYLYF